jgi:hypothetical protein
MTVDTSLNITGLDFQTIRSNLRNYIASKPEFSDYDFDDAAIGTLLDLLAYNTYYMGYYANMAANEGFLDTAQLYESVVSHAKLLGYLPTSAVGPTANVKIIYSAPIANSTVAAITISKNTQFKSTVNGVSYTFVTPKSYTITANSSNIFSGYVDLVEGLPLTHLYLYSPANTSFVLPNQLIDSRSVGVTVTTSGNTQNYSQATNLLSANSSSQIFFLEGDRGGKYKVAFGDGVIGKAPAAGSVVSVSYRVCNSTRANGARNFTAVGTVGGYSTFTLSTLSSAAGGAGPESIESIRYNAPRNYETQNRAVTTNDYRSIVLRNNPDLKSVSVWGGEENDPPIYGKVYISVVPNTGTLISSDRKSRIITDLRQYNIQSIGAEIVDPTYLYIIPTVGVRYDPLATTKSASEIAAAVATKIISYESTELDRFDGRFRYSQFLKNIDLSDTSITTSSAVIRAAKRFVASTSNKTSYVIRFNAAIYHPYDGNAYAVSSSAFTYGGLTSYFDDDGYGNLRIYHLDSTGARAYAETNIGTVDYTRGIIQISAFLPSATALNNSEIQIIVSVNDQNVEPIRNQVLLISGSTITVYNDNTGALEYAQSTVGTLGNTTTLLQSLTSSIASY